MGGEGGVRVLNLETPGGVDKREGGVEIMRIEVAQDEW